MLSRIVRFIGDSHLFIALCGVSLAALTPYLHGINLGDFHYFSFLFIGVLLIYNVQVLRIFGVSLVKGKKFKVKIWQAFLFVLGMLWCSFSWILFPLNVQIILILLFGLSILYYIPFFGKSASKLALKQIAGVKVALIAIVWATCTAVIPLILMGDKLDNTHYLFIAERFIFLFALAIPFDFRDYAEDIEAKVPTFPVLIGKDKSVKMSILIMALFGLVVLLNPFNSDYKFALLLSAAISIVAIYFSKNQKNGLYFHYVVDGMMLLQVALVFELTILK
ncbi:MAG: 4-hydroxybenzoate polyprenyltransferase [Sphingobacteriales bacterium]|jgi:4-hydroxybenzoate polyprenyltransferase